MGFWTTTLVRNLQAEGEPLLDAASALRNPPLGYRLAGPRSAVTGTLDEGQYLRRAEANLPLLEVEGQK